MKQILGLLLALLSLPILAQKTTIIGTVTDSMGNGLPSASVVLMEIQDSVIAQFGVTNTTGAFTLKRLEKGEYLLQITYTGYDGHYQTITTGPDRPQIDLGKIVLLPANLLLNGVDITADRSPMRMQNDTINYNAGYFQTQPGSMVEDLLKKLPGVEVQSDGTIKAQGQVVKNVMVDGKAFFGQDPKIATKNLPANIVDKVQVYDKKSERAEFTGIDDGQEEKTINLKLKDGAKTGYFGNAAMGYGTADRYEGRFSLNKFSGKTQISALGSANNTNQQAFSINDYISFMGGLSNLMSSSGGGRVRIALDDPSGDMMGGEGGNGFTAAWAGGLNLNHDFSKKTQLSANYFYNRIQKDLDRRTQRENLLADRLFNSSEQETRWNRNNNHRVNLTLKSKIDSVQHLTFRTNWVLNDAMFRSLTNSSTNDPFGTLQNTADRNYQTQGGYLRGDGNVTYKRKFDKRGRAVVADAAFQKSDDTRTGRLLANTRFISQGGDSLFNARQRQNYTDDATNWSTSLSYTEPIGRKQYLEWRAAFRQYTNETNKPFYDTLMTPTVQEVFNPLLSNHYQRGYHYQRGTMNYTLNREKYNLTAGTTLQQSVLEGQLLGIENTPISRRFNRILPALNYQYEPRAGVILSLDYNTALREPSLEQLQPVVDNSNPLQIFTGNPDLQPEYAHEIDLSFMRFDAFSNTMFFAGLNGAYTLNKITNAGSIDALLRTNTRPVNVKNDMFLEGYMQFGRPLRSLKSNLKATLNNSFNRGILFINDAENITQRWVNNFEITLDNKKKKKIDMEIGARWSHNITRYSVSNALNQQFINQRYFTNLAWFPTSKWAINSGFDYTIYSKESFGAAQQIPLWKASVTRYVLKNRKGQIKLSAFDLLNKNVGITRSSNFNFTEEVRTRNLSRYFMLTFAYSISGFGENNGGGIQINRIGG
jgi:hypothetical protein